MSSPADFKDDSITNYSFPSNTHSQRESINENMKYTPAPGMNQYLHQTPFNQHHAWTEQMRNMTNQDTLFTAFPHQMMQTPSTFHSPPNSDGSASATCSSAFSSDDCSPSSSDSFSSSNGGIYSGQGAIWSDNSNAVAPDLEQKFDEVPGRLCLLSASTKYKVTLGEVVRRMSAPETLHTSLINGVLRKGKAKDNGVRLRRALEDKNIKLPSGRRKTAPTTGFTAFCEAEAVNLASDFCSLVAREGGAEMIAEEMVARRNTEEAKVELAAKWETIIQGMYEIRQIYASIPVQPADIKPKTAAEVAINKFSLLTHGFGHTALLGSIDHIRRVGFHTIKACGQTPAVNMDVAPSDLPMPPMPSMMPFSGMHPIMMSSHPAAFFPTPFYGTPPQ